jgi:hypothetical protein
MSPVECCQQRSSKESWDFSHPTEISPLQHSESNAHSGIKSSHSSIVRKSHLVSMEAEQRTWTSVSTWQQWGNLFFLLQYKRKPSEVEVLNKIQFHNIIWKCVFQSEITQHTNKQKTLNWISKEIVYAYTNMTEMFEIFGKDFKAQAWLCFNT